ncbi:MAG: cytochrome c3 family protein [Rhodospirillales bacterium]
MVLRRAPFQTFIAPIVYLSANLISRIGVVLVTSAVVFWIFLFPMTMRAEGAHPYVGILEFLILPAGFFAGLALIPLGIWLRVRRDRKRGVSEVFAPLTLHTPALKRLALFVGITTVVNLVLGSLFTYQAVSYMDSVAFCGRTCHTVMEPEYAAYQNSPHSRVECVACHIGPGASWFVKSKLSGTWQVIAVTFNTYPRPIPTPVHNLRPARETCEACHWPQKFGEDRLRIINNYADDETNTLTQTVLLMRIGGGRGGPGIHGAHLGPGVTIHYSPADESRQTIPKVEYHNSLTGRSAVYLAAGAKAEEVNNLPTRLMDCMDCHNRPTHTFSLPEREINKAMAAGDISPSLPFVKKKGTELLKATYSSHKEAEAAIAAGLDGFYKENHPEVYAGRREDIARAAASLVSIYKRNVFPAMKVTWGTYPNNIGHMDFPGCFRCHDDEHAAADGKKIGQDCSSCHQILAMEEPSPKILTDLGLQ